MGGRRGCESRVGTNVGVVAGMVAGVGVGVVAGVFASVGVIFIEKARLKINAVVENYSHLSAFLLHIS